MSEERILRLASAPEAMEKTIRYLAEKMRTFLRKGEQVLICFDDKPGSFGDVLKQAVEACQAVPVIWGPDYRWKTLLRQAFFCKAGTIIAPPLLVLGLTKLARATATPLYIRDVVTAGYPCLDWMIDGIRAGLDCRSWGCFDWNRSCVVAGFSCGGNRGLHLRDDEYSVKIIDCQGKELPEGAFGEIMLYHKDAPEALVSARDSGRLVTGYCACGNSAPLLMDILPKPRLDDQLFQAGEEILRWSSVLDCRLSKGDSGLEIEIVVFPGEKLPKLPSCAKLTVRPWDPESDAPFETDTLWYVPVFSGESH